MATESVRVRCPFLPHRDPRTRDITRSAADSQKRTSSSAQAAKCAGSRYSLLSWQLRSFCWHSRPEARTPGREGPPGPRPRLGTFQNRVTVNLSCDLAVASLALGEMHCGGPFEGGKLIVLLFSFLYPAHEISCAGCKYPNNANCWCVYPSPVTARISSLTLLGSPVAPSATHFPSPRLSAFSKASPERGNWFRL